jgi:Ser/Thr protein kinase RdoA (MazF antagonist)
MEKDLKAKYNKEIVEKLLKRFRVNYADADLVGTHQNYVYKAQVDGHNIYIRITLNNHRSVEQIKAEIDMIQYLSARELDVAKPIASVNSNFVETMVDENTLFIAVAFTEANGLGFGWYRWNSNIPYRVGVMTGKLHNILEDYAPRTKDRPTWFENTFIENAMQYLPSDHEKVIEELKSLIKEISQLPQPKSAYGLIHGDIVACNYHMTEDSISLFDFDEASYCWFLNDIAISTFYDSLTLRGNIDIEGTKKSFVTFIKGYQSVRPIDKYWLQKLPLFIRLREIILYVSIHQSKDVTNLSEWARIFMDGRKERIEQGVPYVELNFEDLI